MTRREARELAFTLLFEKTFTDYPVRQIIENAVQARDIACDDFALSLAEGVEKHMGEIDEAISEHLHKWRKERLSRVALSIIRLSVYEILYSEDIPVSVSINEAVELAKKYGGDDDPSFVNGVLGGIARQEGE
jgi:N utilization substance protein B